MNRLKAYVRRTILQSAKEGAAYYTTSQFKPTTAREAKARALKDAFTDASRGTDTGWWRDLIYTVDVERLARRYRGDIVDAVLDYLGETGQATDERLGRDGPSAAAVLIAALKASRKPSEGDMDALGYGLRFAVEWLTSEVASDLGVEL